MRNRNADAAVTAAIGGILWMAIIFGLSAFCAFVLTPYVVEHWAAWCGKIIVIEWWKGFVIYILFGIFSRNAAAGVAIALSLLTLVMTWFGFSGFV